MNSIAHFIYTWTGAGHGGQPNTGYSFWSGIGSCLAYVTALGFAWHHLVCHDRGCRRVGRHHVAVDGITYRVCRRHHPRFGDGTGAVHAAYHTSPTATVKEQP